MIDKQIIIITLLTSFIIYLLYPYLKKQNLEPFEQNEEMRAFIINMDKNPERYKATLYNYNQTDLTAVKVERFSAVDGKKVDINEWLTEEAIEELKEVEKNSYRTKHYQLTRGGIGCFLSHYSLAKQLLSDNSVKYYLILEDDLRFDYDTYSQIVKSIENAPENWHYLAYGYVRSKGVPESNYFNKLIGYWGTQGYVINKEGARILVNEVEKNKIDGQIDAYISRLSQQNKMNIYGYYTPIIVSDGLTTDIQVPIEIGDSESDAFNFRGYSV